MLGGALRWDRRERERERGLQWAAARGARAKARVSFMADVGTTVTVFWKWAEEDKNDLLLRGVSGYIYPLVWQFCYLDLL